MRGVRSLQKRFASSQAAPQLDWPEYFRLRSQRRLVGTIMSVPTTLLGFAVGAVQFGSKEADPTALIMGIEPIYVYGGLLISCCGLGYLAGPSVGNGAWRIAQRRIMPAMEAKDRMFFQHVKAKRADAARQSMQNPLPDYYAEKVGSLKQYRQWLRDQAVFKRKALFGGGTSLS